MPKMLIDSLNNDLRMVAGRDDLKILAGPVDGCFHRTEEARKFAVNVQCGEVKKRVSVAWNELGTDAPPTLDMTHRHLVAAAIGNIWQAFKKVPKAA